MKFGVTLRRFVEDSRKHWGVTNLKYFFPFISIFMSASHIDCHKQNGKYNSCEHGCPGAYLHEENDFIQLSGQYDTRQGRD